MTEREKEVFEGNLRQYQRSPETRKPSLVYCILLGFTISSRDSIAIMNRSVGRQTDRQGPAIN